MIGLTDVAMGLSLLNRFKDVVPGLSMVNRDIVFAPEDVALRVHAERVGEDNLEFLSYWREGTTFSWKRNQSVAANKGLFTHVEDGVFKGLLAVPVDLRYRVVYWTNKKRSANDFFKQYLFWVHDNPELSFKIFKQEIENCLDMHFEDPTEQVTDWFKDSRYYTVRADIMIDGYVVKDTRDFQVTKVILTAFLTGVGEDVQAFVRTITEGP